MRHPMLFGLALLPLSVALILGSPTFIIFVAPIEMIFIVAMILTFEEAEYKAKFGDSLKIVNYQNQKRYIIKLL